MAFGISRNDVKQWKTQVSAGEIAFLTHYWFDPRFPHYKTVTKVGCGNKKKLIQWGRKYGLKPEWIDNKKDFPHFDILGERQIKILLEENMSDHLKRFNILKAFERSCHS